MNIRFLDGEHDIDTPLRMSAESTGLKRRAPAGPQLTGTTPCSQAPGSWLPRFSLDRAPCRNPGANYFALAPSRYDLDKTR